MNNFLMSNYQLNHQDDLSLAIKKVIVFFDLFDFTLSQFEIYNFLEKKYPLADINDVLNSLIERIETKNGFYFLKGREELVVLRQKRYNYSVRKLKIAERYAKVFSCLPFIKVITLANVIGAHNMRDEGDIDFFIITAKGRIWLSRLFCAGLAKLLNKRPTQEIKKDKLCLSFYVSSDNLNLDSLKIKPEDPYFEYWLETMVLLYNKNGIYQEFLKANNISTTIDNQNKDEKIKSNKVLDYFEEAAKKWELKIMPEALKQVRINSKGEFINDKILKLYWRDRNAEILEKYNYALHQLS